MNAKEWYAKRFQKVEAPRGSYLVQVPDVVQLLLDWKEAGVKDFSPQAVAEKKVFRFLFLKYIKEPKVSEEKEDGSIWIEDLLADQADSLEIYKKIIGSFTSDPKKVSEFFRNLPTESKTASGLSGTALPQTTKRNTRNRKSKSNGKNSP